MNGRWMNLGCVTITTRIADALRQGCMMAVALVCMPAYSQTAVVVSSANSGIHSPVASQRVENLRAFAKLYGYVRYFHPSDEAAVMDWNQFAVYGVGKVKNATTTNELKIALEGLFLPIAPTLQILRASEQSGFFYQRAVAGSATKVISWQHKGLGIELTGSPQQQTTYHSIRLNRTIPNGLVQNFCTKSQFVDAAPFRGKDVMLVAAVRTDTMGTAQLWLRVDRPPLNGKPQYGFVENMQNKPIMSDEWRDYNIIGHVSDDATGIAFGCLLSSKGAAYFDDVRLFIRDNASQEWKPFPVENGGFEQAMTDLQPERWSGGGVGYTTEVFKGQSDAMRQVEGKQCLKIEQQPVVTLFDKRPTMGESIAKELGSGLKCSLPLALVGDDKTTVGATPRTISQMELLQFGLQGVNLAQVTGLDEDLRLADAVIAWNVLQHFYPYFDVVSVDWDKELTTALQAVLENKNELEFLYTMRQMMTALSDGQSNFTTSRPFSADRMKAGGLVRQMGLPFIVDEAEGQVVVTSSKDSTVRRGDVIMSIDGVGAAQRLAMEEQRLSGSPQWNRYRSLAVFPFGDSGSVASIMLKRGTVMVNTTLNVALTRNYAGDPIRESTRASVEKMANGVWYVSLDKASMADIAKNINEIAQAKGVVFDLRGYPNNNHEVLAYLTDKPLLSVRWNTPLLLYPDQKNIVGYDSSGRWNLAPREPRIKGKVVFLTNGRAINYAESVMGVVEHYKLGEIIGGTTAGANGNVNTVYMPGGYMMYWTGMKVLKHDGSQHHLVGIKPTIPVVRTLKGITEGRDELFDKAVSVIVGQ